METKYIPVLTQWRLESLQKEARDSWINVFDKINERPFPVVARWGWNDYGKTQEDVYY